MCDYYRKESEGLEALFNRLVVEGVGAVHHFKKLLKRSGVAYLMVGQAQRGHRHFLFATAPVPAAPLTRMGCRSFRVPYDCQKARTEVKVPTFGMLLQ